MHMIVNVFAAFRGIVVYCLLLLLIGWFLFRTGANRSFHCDRLEQSRMTGCLRWSRFSMSGAWEPSLTLVVLFSLLAVSKLPRRKALV